MKKAISILISVAVLFALVGCNASTIEDVSSEASDQVASATSSEPVSGNTLLWFSLDTADTNYFYKSFSCQSSVTSQSFTMPVSDRNYYPSMVAYVHINAQSVVSLSNGYDIIQNTSLIFE